MKKALINVTSMQSESERVESITPGSFYKEGGFYYAVYDETAISGMEGTHTTLKIGENHLVLEREGSTSAKMEFEQGREHVSLYNTPYGGMEVKIDTKSMKIDVDETGGEVAIDYYIEVGPNAPMKTTLKINIKTK